MEDERIIELYWQRSQDAIAQTDKKYGGLCHRISFSILSSVEDSEECVSDTYLAVWNSLPPQRPARLQTFVAAIVRNISISRVRERYSKKRGSGELALALDELDDCFPSEGSVEQELELKELVLSINEFLHSLSRDDRNIFVSRYWLLESTADIAARSGFSQSKVLSSLYHTRQKLQRFLTKEGLI